MVSMVRGIDGTWGGVGKMDVIGLVGDVRASW